VLNVKFELFFVSQSVELYVIFPINFLSMLVNFIQNLHLLQYVFKGVIYPNLYEGAIFCLPPKLSQ